MSREDASALRGRRREVSDAGARRRRSKVVFRNYAPSDEALQEKKGQAAELLGDKVVKEVEEVVRQALAEVRSAGEGLLAAAARAKVAQALS